MKDAGFPLSSLLPDLLKIGLRNSAPKLLSANTRGGLAEEALLRGSEKFYGIYYLHL
jgi:hypothetical protein